MSDGYTRCAVCHVMFKPLVGGCPFCSASAERDALLAEVEAAHMQLDSEGVMRREEMPSLRARIERLGTVSDINERSRDEEREENTKLAAEVEQLRKAYKEQEK